MLKNGPTEPKYKFPEPNPFVSEEEDGEVASVGYRYRKWNLNNGVVSTFLFAICFLGINYETRRKKHSQNVFRGKHTVYLNDNT